MFEDTFLQPSLLPEIKSAEYTTPILSLIFNCKGNIATSSIEHNQANHGAVSLLIVSVVYHILTGNESSIKFAYQDVAFMNFVQGVLSQTNSPSSTLLLSLFYMKKLSAWVSLVGSKGSEYRIWLTSLILADAFLNDNAFKMDSWSKVSSLNPAECVAMRREFLTGLRFELRPTEQEYIHWLNGVEGFLGRNSGYFQSLIPGLQRYPYTQSIPMTMNPVPMPPIFPISPHDSVYGTVEYTPQAYFVKTFEGRIFQIKLK